MDSAETDAPVYQSWEKLGSCSMVVRSSLVTIGLSVNERLKVMK